LAAVRLDHHAKAGVYRGTWRGGGNPEGYRCAAADAAGGLLLQETNFQIAATAAISLMHTD
jgi:hypothetical protein